MKTIKAHTPNTQYHFAIYKDSEGNLAFCKLWRSKQKDQAYKWICNEIAVYSRFTQVYKKYGKEIYRKFPEIRVPTLHESKITATKAYFLVDLIKGEKLEVQDDKSKAVLFERIMVFFTFITPYLVAGKHHIFRLSKIYLFALFHYYLFVAVASRKLQLSALLRVTGIFYIGFIDVIFSRKNVFVHRDLGFGDNVLLSKGKVYLLDFQLSSLSNPLIELANITIANFDHQRQKKLLFKQPTIRSILKQETHRRQFFAFLAHSFLVTTVLQLRQQTRTSEYFVHRFPQSSTPIPHV